MDFPHDFRAFRGYHAGETMLVCGCGASLSEIIAPERLITIGVNDVGRLFDPDYLLVVNPPSQFAHDRFRYVAESRASAVFTQFDLGISHPRIIRFRLGQRGGADISDPDTLPYTRNSPYPALCLAAHMGARRIGLIGVDFTDNHFFGPTGRHALAGEFPQIEREYRQLYENLSRQGIEIFNLSRESRLTAFPKIAPEEFMRFAVSPPRSPGRKVFFVNYKFLSCGDVFSDGLAHAADQLGLSWRQAQWDDPQLPREVEEFDPDVLFVVHGRKFAARWGTRFAHYKTAVWLLDEPYEVDDTSRFSSLFDTVFVNDPSTLHRHRSARYLPVCYDPVAYSYSPPEPRPHAVGFIGGFNPWREQSLTRLQRRGLLSYVVGGPWSDPALRQICLAPKIPPEETARLYRGTRIVVNLFRSRHHYNRDGVAAVALNPRVYEGLACGALVISEHRPELDTVCPEMPVFRSAEEMEFQIDRHLRDPDLYARVRKACIRRLASHTYAQRLAMAMPAVLGEVEVTMPSSLPAALPAPPEWLADWEANPQCVHVDAEGSVVLRKHPDGAPGSERGLVGRASYRGVSLEFEVQLEPGAEFIAKIHQAEARNQLSNSYHLMCRGDSAYVARHNFVFSKLSVPVDAWTAVALCYEDGAVVVRIDGAEVARANDRVLQAGYCFLGVKGGAVRLRNVRIDALQRTPTVSIVTTVFDRVDCLERCIQSVQALHFKDYEHIVVADAPPTQVLDRIEKLIEAYNRGGNLTFTALRERKNDWGISPAAAGLELARGRYICFLSDDNGYLPGHFDKLVEALDGDPGIGFVYSSCLYAGRAILNSPIPRPGRIDLGQPLLRRELFGKYLGGGLPFHEFGWDWRMIERFLRGGVRWRHVNDATFVFRLAQYPHLIPEPDCVMISYCIACYRPSYARQLIDDLIAKTSAKYEILLWINVVNADFEQFLAGRIAAGAPIRVIGRSPENIGMAAYPYLFAASQGEMVAQIDDDVICVSPRIAETAKEIFDRFPEAGMLTADVWQDEYTTGARPPIDHYRIFNSQFGLYDGPIDGWFAVYRKSSLAACGDIRPGRYFSLGCTLKARLGAVGQRGLLCTRMKVFHVTDPAYVAHFGMLDAEVAKYRLIGRQDQVDVYTAARDNLPPAAELSRRIDAIRESLGT
jgi:glycosyltransferase involved in cell wall biosynthesis